MAKTRDVLLDPLLDNNPIALQVLGICSALAVTTKVSTAFVMSLAVTGVIVGSSLTVSLLRHRIPASIRIITQLTTIASLVIIGAADEIDADGTARFLAGMRSIIRTATAKIMTWLTSKPCPLENTCQVMGRIDQRNTGKRIVRQWIKRAWRRQNGTDQRKAERGIAYMASWRGKTASLLRLFANTAALNLKLLHPTATRSSVLTNANQPHEERLESIGNLESVHAAGNNSWWTNIKKQHNAPTYVLSVLDNDEVLPVYNLTIDTVGEYYANGVLVHNCDSLRYACAWLTAPQTGVVRVGYEAVPIGERRY